MDRNSNEKHTLNHEAKKKMLLYLSIKLDALPGSRTPRVRSARLEASLVLGPNDNPRIETPFMGFPHHDRPNASGKTQVYLAKTTRIRVIQCRHHHSTVEALLTHAPLSRPWAMDYQGVWALRALLRPKTRS